MNINTISYLVADAFHTMKKDLKNELISLGTMLATMVLIATAHIVYANATVIINDNKDKSSNIMAYLEIGLSDKEMQEIGFEIESIPGVPKDGVSFYSVEESIKSMDQKSKALLAGLTEEQKKEMIHAFYVVEFENSEAVPGIINNIREIKGVGQGPDDVLLDPYALEAQKDAKIYKTLAITAMILIVEFSIFLMMNTTKLMMYAKRREISIMKYVGAKDDFIKAPFAIQGVITALVAIFVTMALASVVYPTIVGSMDAFSGDSYLEFELISKDLIWLLLIIGFVIGIGGSTASMNKYLDV